MQGAQYTAAGICAELRSMAYPLSVSQVVTNNDNQDIVSFGLQSSLKGMEIALLLSYVLAVESLAAIQGLWLHFHQQNHKVEELSPVTRIIYERLLKTYTPQAMMYPLV